MKKIVVTIIFLLSIILISMQKYNVKAVATEEDMEKYDILDLTIEDIEKDYTLYILLSKEYIEYAINLSGLDITYSGANTLIENDIPGIEIIKENALKRKLINIGGLLIFYVRSCCVVKYPCSMRVRAQVKAPWLSAWPLL